MSRSSRRAPIAFGKLTDSQLARLCQHVERVQLRRGQRRRRARLKRGQHPPACERPAELTPALRKLLGQWFELVSDQHTCIIQILSVTEKRTSHSSPRNGAPRAHATDQARPRVRAAASPRRGSRRSCSRAASRYESAGSSSIRSTSSAAPELDHRLAAVPGVVEEERALAAHHLQLVPIGHGGAAVEMREHVARKAHRAGENPVRAGLAEIGLAVDALGLACEEPRRR